MSSVRMCDRCGTIFSEREDGWSTYSGTRVERGKDGIRRGVTDEMDACAKCTGGGNPVTPRLALSTDANLDRLAAVQTDAERTAALGGK